MNADARRSKVVTERIIGCEEFDDAHVAQCLNYLKATGLKICLLINFGKTKVEIKRLVREL